MRESQLDIWENELLAYPVWVRILVVVALSIIAFIIIWELWISDISESVDRLEYQNRKIERRIARVNLKVYENTIRELKHKILLAKSEEEQSRYRLRYLMSASSKYDFLWFDEERFLNILREVLSYSVKLGIRVDEIKSIPIYGDENSTAISNFTGIVKRIRIAGAGSYADIIKMIYFIESFNVLFEISGTKIWLDSKSDEIKFNLIVTQYGMKR